MSKELPTGNTNNMSKELAIASTSYEDVDMQDVERSDNSQKRKGVKKKRKGKLNVEEQKQENVLQNPKDTVDNRKRKNESETNTVNGMSTPPPSKKKKKKKKKSEHATLDYDIDLLFSNNGRRPGGSHLTMKDIRALYMLAIHGGSFFIHPNWCLLKNFQRIKKTLILMAAGVSAEDFHAHKDLFKSLILSFPRELPVRNEGSEQNLKSPLDSMLRYHMPKKLQNQKSHDRKLEGIQRKSAHEYILSPQQLEANEFPIWSDELVNDGFLSTSCRHGINPVAVDNSSDGALEESHLLAVDCEMCTVENGRVLTRVSVVDEELGVVYDKYVKPSEPIVDYLTKFSGITPDLLEGVKTCLEDVQRDLLDIVRKDTILIGHSLDFDLRALKLHHENVIDTSVLFEDARGPRFKPSLKQLSRSLLQREIQMSEGGHCSIEDARACMELVKMKVERGASFGEITVETESIFEAATRVKKMGVLLAAPHIVRQHTGFACHSYPCFSDDEVVAKAGSAMGKGDVVFAQLTGFERELKATDGCLTTVRKRELLIELDENIGRFLAAVPPASLIVVSLSSGFLTSHIAGKQRDKELRKHDDVRVAVKRARDGICFVKLSPEL